MTLRFRVPVPIPAGLFRVLLGLAAPAHPEAMRRRLLTGAVGRRRHLQRGFTLIELLVVIAIIAILIGQLLPPVNQARQSVNAAAAITVLRQIHLGQAVFLAEDRDGDGQGDYAPGIAHLIDAGLVDSSLSDFLHKGYRFEMTADPSGQYWAAVASPTGPRRYLAQLAVNIVDYLDEDEIGFIYVDETGLLRQDPCPPGYMPVAIDGNLECVPAAIQIESSLGSGPGTMDLAIASLKDLGQAHPGALSEARRALSDPALVEAVKARFDTGGDGRLDVGELVGADLLDIARSIVGRPRVPPPPIGDDAALRIRLKELQASIAKALAFTDDEENLPAVQLDQIQNLPVAASVLELVSEDPRDAAISVLQAAIGELDVRPADGDMVGVSQRLNERRKGRLVGGAEGLTGLLRFGRVGALTADLRRLRTQATEWLVPAAAEGIVRLVDRALAAVRSEG